MTDMILCKSIIPYMLADGKNSAGLLSELNLMGDQYNKFILKENAYNPGDRKISTSGQV